MPRLDLFNQKLMVCVQRGIVCKFATATGAMAHNPRTAFGAMRETVCPLDRCVNPLKEEPDQCGTGD